VLAAKLPRLRDFLKRELMPDFRLGTEMANRARFWGKVGGIFHTDEMPAYGVTAEEIEQLREKIKAEEWDAIVFVADKPENAEDALKAVVKRAQEATKGVPEETRAPNPDGTTSYMRPRPGAARMYPETDIPQTQITEDYLTKIRQHLPEFPEQRLERLTKEYKLNQKLAKQVLDSEYGKIFETIVKESNVSPTTAAAFLTETLKALKRDGVETEKVSENKIREIFQSMGTGELTKEALADVFSWLSKHDKTVKEAIDNLGLRMLSKEEITEIIDTAIENNKNLIKERGANTFGVIMGIVMKEVRGKADATLVSELLKRRLKED
jgi:glutamyl-tRNA(Gln) amidotransferase subunit E